MKWLFDRETRGRSGGSAAQYAFRPNLGTFVREVVQNSKDQSVDGASVTVRFQLIRLDGDELEKYLQVLGWRDLQPHLSAAAESSNHAAYLKQSLERIDDEQSVLLFRVDDFGTGGLIGGDFDRGAPFTSLCVDELFSEKGSSQSGGSYGLGKSVLWRFSEFSTVLFSSHTDPPDPINESRLRVFGRCQLPWHEVESNGFDGRGWFGVEGKARDGSVAAVSDWLEGSDPLSESLCLTRGDKAGTSICVVGFRPPAEEKEVPDDELCKRLVNHASDWFWPVLGGAQPDLKVEAVRLDAAGEVLQRESAGVTPRVQPFQACVSGWAEGIPVDQLLEEEGDLATADIEVQVPGRRDGKHGKLTARAALVVRLGGDKNSERLNEVSYSRGFGMVVRYRRLDGLSLSARPFHATLLCGSARGSSPEDLALEEFLRWAEPPEHNRWEATQRLRSLYHQGWRVALDKIESNVRAALRTLVRQPAGSGKQGPTLLSRMFPIGRGGAPGKKYPFSVLERQANLSPEGFWLFSGRIVCNEDGATPWKGAVALRFGNDDGRAEDAAVGALVTTPEVEVTVTKGIARFSVPGNVSQLAFEGRSDIALHPVDSDRCSVRLDVGGELTPSEEGKATQENIDES